MSLGNVDQFYVIFFVKLLTWKSTRQGDLSWDRESIGMVFWPPDLINTYIGISVAVFEDFSRC